MKRACWSWPSIATAGSPPSNVAERRTPSRRAGGAPSQWGLLISERLSAHPPFLPLSQSSSLPLKKISKPSPFLQSLTLLAIPHIACNLSYCLKISVIVKFQWLLPHWSRPHFAPGFLVAFFLQGGTWCDFPRRLWVNQESGSTFCAPTLYHRCSQIVVSNQEWSSDLGFIYNARWLLECVWILCGRMCACILSSLYVNRSVCLNVFVHLNVFSILFTWMCECVCICLNPIYLNVFVCLWWVRSSWM